MPLTAVKPSQIRKIAALSLVGNATGAEARGTSLSASQVRTLLGLGTVDSPSFSGMTLSGHLLFNATNTYDVGNGTYDPRTVRAATSVLSPLFNNPAAAATTLGNSTYGVTFPGNVTCPGVGTASERFGAGATAAGLRGVAVGNGATSSGDRSASGGYSATAGEYGAAWGYFANATANSVAVGGLCGYAATGVGYTSIGYFTVPGAYNYGIQLGYQAAATASNQFQIGSAAAPITQQRFATQGGSLTFANETGTFLTAANTGLLTLGNSTYGVTVPGKLGVGTATPGNNFSVLGTAASPLLSDKTRGVASFVTDVALSGVQLNVGGYASGSYGIWLQTLYQPLSQAYPLLLNPLGGVVGVGTSTPTAPFEVHGSVQDQPISTFQNTGTNTSGGGIAFITNSTQPAARNWAIAFNKVAYGDFSIIQSNAKDGAPLSAGTSRLYIDASGNATFSGDISMSKTSAQGYIRAYGTGGVNNIAMYDDNTNGILSTSSGALDMRPASGLAYIYSASANADFRVYKLNGIDYAQMKHDGTNSIFSGSTGETIVESTHATKHVRLKPVTGIVYQYTAGVNAEFDVLGSGGSVYGYIKCDNTNTIVGSSSGNLNLVPAGGTVAVTGAVTTTGKVGIGGAASGSYMVKVSGSVNSAQILLDATSGSGSEAGLLIYNAGALRYQIYDNGTSSGFGIYNAGTASHALQLNYSTNAATFAGAISCAGITASGNVSYAQGLSTGTVTKSANYTTTADDYRVNVTANSIDITFETAVGCTNREHEVVNSGSGVVTLKTTSAQTISGSASGALTLAQWKSIRVVSDGANWIIVSQIN